MSERTSERTSNLEFCVLMTGLMSGGALLTAIIMAAVSLLAEHAHGDSSGILWAASILGAIFLGFALLAVWLYTAAEASERRDRVDRESRKTPGGGPEPHWALKEEGKNKKLTVSAESELRPGTRYEWSCRVKHSGDGYTEIGRPKLVSVNGGEIPQDVRRWTGSKPEAAWGITPQELPEECRKTADACRRATQAAERAIAQEKTKLENNVLRERERRKALGKLMEDSGNTGAPGT